MSIYRTFGVEPIINASGAVTRLGGSPMPADVLDAFCEAASEWVPLEQMQAAASRKIAEHTGTEAGLVAAGAAAALTLGTAAILAGHDLRRIESLPHCDDFPNEMLIAREQRSGYDHAIRAAGARFVEVGFNEIVAGAGVRRTEPWEYDAAVTDQTAGIVYVYAPDSKPDLARVIEVARRHNLPVLVDAAGELPPRSNLQEIAATGADLVAFSGGKSIRGPQSTGLLCGRRSLISSAAIQMLDMDDHWELWDPPPELIDRSQLAGIPRHGIGRGSKVSKESIVAVLTALDLFASGSYDAELARYEACLNTIRDSLSDARCECRVLPPVHDEMWPLLEISPDIAAAGRSAVEICRRLRVGSPPIYVGHGRLNEGVLIINPTCINDDAVGMLADRLKAELS